MEAMTFLVGRGETFFSPKESTMAAADVADLELWEPVSSGSDCSFPYGEKVTYWCDNPQTGHEVVSICT